MAENKIKMGIKWEDNSHFESTAKANIDGVEIPNFNIISVDENNHMINAWREITEIMEKFIRKVMADILVDMKE